MKNLLYVEDDFTNAFILKRLLHEEFNITVVEDGEACLAKIEEKQFDLILMDINLGSGKMDGMETMRKVRQHKGYQFVPIFAVTAFAMPEDESRFLTEGFDHYAPKPIEKEVIIKDIYRFLKIAQR